MKRNKDLHQPTEGVVIVFLITSAVLMVVGLIKWIQEMGIVFGTISIALTVVIIWGGRVVKWIQEAWLAR